MSAGERLRNGSFNCGRQSDPRADTRRLNADDGDGGWQVSQQARGGKQFQRVAPMGGDGVMGGDTVPLKHVDGSGWRPQCDGIKDDQGAAIREVREECKPLGSAVEIFSGSTLGGKILQQAQTEAIIAEQQVAEPKHQDVS